MEKSMETQKDVRVWRQNRIIAIVPENEEGREKVKAALPSLIESGYMVKKKSWGYIVSDPTMRFGWEAREMLLDVKKILGEL